ncbi:MAG TPA: hypothetical protein VM097_04260 [Mycobacteriales bacterium]|nr:hypothetical protein [Mycobacteriales bacterium]
MAATTSDAVKTYRYVRLSMITLVLGLAAAVAVERLEVAAGCFQHSISAYYYTPVRGMFVGGLLGIGVCLVALRGNNDAEDALLNLAGMLAPVVAFVPTPSQGTCSSSPGSGGDRDADVYNNMSALFVIGVLGLAVTAWLLWKDQHRLRSSVVGFALGVALLVAAVLVFALARGFFVRNAHYAAAVTMFAAILGVVVLNALGFHRKQVAQGREPTRPYTNRYAVIAGAMIAGAGGIGVWDVAVGWDHAVLWIEGVLITLFGVFWAMQTEELWEGGVRAE